MSRPLLLALIAVAASTIASTPAMADKQDRQARRGAIVAGAVRENVMDRKAEERYEACKRGTSYDEACERQRYEDEQKAHRAARRTAIIVGAD
ncbi:MAG: hypothetical protein ACK58C_07690 [Betaproteobacteria bacterium]|jgi:hypothetical protein